MVYIYTYQLPINSIYIYIYIYVYVMLDPPVDVHISQAAHGRYGLSLGGCQTSCLETSAPKGAERGWLGWKGMGGLEIIYALPPKKEQIWKPQDNIPKIPKKHLKFHFHVFF